MSHNLYIVICIVLASIEIFVCLSYKNKSFSVTGKIKVKYFVKRRFSWHSNHYFLFQKSIELVNQLPSEESRYLRMSNVGTEIFKKQA